LDEKPVVQKLKPVYLAIEPTQFARTVFQFLVFPKQTMPTPLAKSIKDKSELKTSDSVL
jgi:hypothetical protein